MFRNRYIQIYHRQLQQMNLVIPFIPEWVTQNNITPNFDVCCVYSSLIIDCRKLNIPEELIYKASEPIVDIRKHREISVMILEYLLESGQKALIRHVSELPRIVSSKWMEALRIEPFPDEITDGHDVFPVKQSPENR